LDWHWPDALHLFHHVPHALGDLLHHEDAALVSAGVAGLRRVPPEGTASPGIGIEKNMDPGVARSEQNVGLLVRDYVRTLPGYVAESEPSAALLEHWRTLLLEQPQRLAEAHLASWNSDRSRAFWHERLSHYRTDCGISSDTFPNALDDWERAAGTVPPPLATLGTLKSKQWQDLLIAQRMHLLDLKNMGRLPDGRMLPGH
jgi:hypothetical protein